MHERKDISYLFTLIVCLHSEEEDNPNNSLIILTSLPGTKTAGNLSWPSWENVDVTIASLQKPILLVTIKHLFRSKKQEPFLIMYLGKIMLKIMLFVYIFFTKQSLTKPSLQQQSFDSPGEPLNAVPHA